MFLVLTQVLADKRKFLAKVWASRIANYIVYRLFIIVVAMDNNFEVIR